MKISKAARKDIVTAIQAGVSATDLGQQYGVKAGQIRHIYRQATGTLLRPVKKLSESQTEGILAALQDDNAQVKEVADRFGVTPAMVSYAYKKHTGKPFRPLASLKLSTEDKEAIVAELTAHTASVSELATRFGVRDHIIRTLFHSRTGKRLGPTNVPSTVKAEIIHIITTDATITKEALIEKYGIHLATLERLIKRETGKTFSTLHLGGAPVRHGKRKISATERKAIVAKLDGGTITMKDLAASYGVTYFTISRIYKRETGHAWKDRSAITEQKAIVSDLLEGKATMRELAEKYHVTYPTITHRFKRQTGHTLTDLMQILDQARRDCRYRAWHKAEMKRFPVLGFDWLNKKLLMLTDGVPAWQPMDAYILVEYSGLKSKPTADYPEGQEICTGDILLFPINLAGVETIVRGQVVFDRKNGWFSIPEMDNEPLTLHHTVCEVIGTIYEHPEFTGHDWENYLAETTVVAPS